MDKTDKGKQVNSNLQIAFPPIPLSYNKNLSVEAMFFPNCILTDFINYYLLSIKMTMLQEANRKMNQMLVINQM